MAKSAAKFRVAPAPLPVLPVAAPVAKGKGAVTAARWGACLKGKAGAVTMLPAHVKALPLETVITCNVAQNPKRGMSEKAFAAYGFAGQGAVTTLGAYYTALAKGNMGGATQAAAHVAWDVNHGFIALG